MRPMLANALGSDKVISCSLNVCMCRYAWWSPEPSHDGFREDGAGPNALYYGHGNKTRLTGLGKTYLEALCPAGATPA